MWNDIVMALKNTPRDIQTVPLRGLGKWFYVYSDGKSVYIENSKSHVPSCQISHTRRLEEDKFEKMLDLYSRRCKGEAVSQEASAVTMNQVYWYGIFSALNI